MREKGRKKKGRTWAEAARTVLEKNPNTPMSHKEILQVIQKEGLKEIRSGTSPLACLNAMLHTNSRGDEGIFYKVPGRMGVYTLKKDVPDGLKELSEGSEESSDVQSDSPTSENNSSSSSDRSSTKEGRKSRWRRKVSTRLSQVSPPQPGCPSPSIPSGKVISSSQKLSKKALKQALKQKQRKQQQCRASGPVSSNHHLLQPQHSKAAGHSTPGKPAWEGKQSDGHSSSSQNSTSSSSPSLKPEPSLPVLGKKPFQRSERLHARQLKRTKCAEIDVETPDSILVNTNLRALINKHTFSALPADCQQRLLLLLPEVDRQTGMDGLMKLSSSALNNEFFTSAAQGWKERLSEGEFTPEMQLRLRQEQEKEKKVEVWKEQFFESYYGQSSGLSPEESKQLTSCLPAPRSPAEAGNPAATAQLQRCAPVPSVAPGKEEAAPLAGPKAQELRAPPAARQGEESKQPHGPRPAEHAGSSDDSRHAPSEFSHRSPPRPPTGAEEPTPMEVPQPAGLGSSGKENASEPKSPAAAAPGAEASPGEEAQEAPAAGAEQMDTGARPAKRKADAPEEALATPEKRPHFAEQSSSRPPFQGPPQPFPIAPVPKVPPLRIPVSRIHGSPAPSPASQVSPRPGFPVTVTSPRRTGARTLADVKARAQMARAQRAAAAAAATIAATAASLVGAIPGPGPGGGRAAERSGPPPGRPHGTVLDLAGPGSGAEPRRRPVLSCPGTGSPAEPPAAPSGAARAQLQSPPPAQLSSASSPGAETPPGPQPALGSVRCTSSGPSAAQGTAAPLAPRASLVPSLGGPRKAPPLLSRGPGAAGGPGARTAGQSLPAAVAAVAAAPAASTGVSRGQGPSLPPLPQVAAVPLKAPPAPRSQGGAVATAAPSHGTLPAAHSLKGPTGCPGASGSTLKGSPSIPASNPLVAQLLRGKEVPMEQILPKPLARGEGRPGLLPPVKEGQEAAAMAAASEGQPLLVAFPSGKVGHQPHGPPPTPSFPGQDLWGPHAQPASGQGPREQLLPAFLQRGPGQGRPLAPSPPSRLPPLPPDFLLESSSASPGGFVLGFMGRRTSRPAMSGHYLLNVSTYGRCAENLRRNLAVPPGSRLSHVEFVEQEQAAGVTSDGGSSGEDAGDTDSAEDEELRVAVKEEAQAPEWGAAEPAAPRAKAVEVEQAAPSRKEGGLRPCSAGQDCAASLMARDFMQVAQAVRRDLRPGGGGGGSSSSTEFRPAGAPAASPPPRPLLLSPSPPSRLFGSPGAAQLLGPGYSGTINVSTSADLHQEALLTGLSDPSRMGDVVSFSVTVTTIPAGQSVSRGGHEHPLHGQAFSGDGGGGFAELPSKCYCRLKAMIVCKGCGAFCHDDCIGPSKLCVSCLVVR
ncbi:putative Polycomb group protein ASXL2 [Elgaria multicarinata webbii]|uniref:putative Polycomb group protein ASXL2 n=1 Tax=Elgaria multicarinata webbii TaxID=159646 RepID=UPI002FCD576D